MATAKRGRYLAERLGPGWRAAKQFLFGITGYPFVRHALEMRRELESIFIVVTIGDLLGVPVLPPIYRLRILPYVAPAISGWKRRIARRKEFWEKEDYDLHGI